MSRIPTQLMMGYGCYSHSDPDSADCIAGQATDPDHERHGLLSGRPPRKSTHGGSPPVRTPYPPLLWSLSRSRKCSRKTLRMAIFWPAVSGRADARIFRTCSSRAVSPNASPRSEARIHVLMTWRPSRPLDFSFRAVRCPSLTCRRMLFALHFWRSAAAATSIHSPSETMLSSPSAPPEAQRDHHHTHR